mgnify:CR=1 FL=1
MQEWVQKVGNALVAKKIYDPQRDIFQGAGEDAAVGGATGLLMSLLTQAIGRARGGNHSEPPNGSTSSGEPASPSSNGGTPATVAPPPNAPAAGAQPSPAPPASAINPMDLIVSPNDLTPENRSFVEQVIRQELADPESVATQTALRSLDTDAALGAYYRLRKPVMEAEALQAQMQANDTPVSIPTENATQPAPSIIPPVVEPDLAAASESARVQREAELAARRDELRRAAAAYGQDFTTTAASPDAAPTPPAAQPPAPVEPVVAPANGSDSGAVRGVDLVPEPVVDRKSVV